MNGDWNLRVDNGAHLLHMGGRCFPCDRDVEALRPWNGHALLLSSDTDCLSLWDGDGLVRTARVGVYPQDMTVQANTAYVCGGADGKLHLLTLPDLHTASEFPLPGMPERIHVQADTAHILTLLTDPEVQTLLLALSLSTGQYREVGRFCGVPGAITADEAGLWLGVSELVMHLPHGADSPDVVIEGVGLARHIEANANGVVVVDSLEGQEYCFRIEKERPSCDERPCV